MILQVEDAIADGRLEPGDRLPPERELATTLGVSRGSVREALRVLEAFGVLAARRGRGADAGSTVTAEQNGLAGLLRIYASLLKVPLSDLVDIRVSIETMTARAAAARRAGSSPVTRRRGPRRVPQARHRVPRRARQARPATCSRRC